MEQDARARPWRFMLPVQTDPQDFSLLYVIANVSVVSVGVCVFL